MSTDVKFERVQLIDNKNISEVRYCELEYLSAKAFMVLFNLLIYSEGCFEHRIQLREPI